MVRHLHEQLSKREAGEQLLRQKRREEASRYGDLVDEGYIKHPTWHARRWGQGGDTAHVPISKL